MKQHGIRGDWTAKSLALHTQAVLQGAFILAKAKGSADIAIESADHLRRYIELSVQRQQKQGKKSHQIDQHLSRSIHRQHELAPLRGVDGDAGSRAQGEGNGRHCRLGRVDGKAQSVVVGEGGPLGKTKNVSPGGIADVSNNLGGFVVVRATRTKPLPNCSRTIRSSRSSPAKASRSCR